MIEKSDAKALAPTVWHKKEQTLLLGCGDCPDREVCGGLRIKASVMSCMDFCCGDTANCLLACPAKADFPLYVHEIDGFDLMHIEKRARLIVPKVPDVVPLIYRSLPLAGVVPADVVAIPFSESYWLRGKNAIPHSRAVLNEKFRLSPNTKLILSAVEEDRYVEHWWSAHGKIEVLRAMREMGVLFATVPNFSAAADVPRHDNMHALKRIALTWAELHDAGIPAAPHANCRTDRDFERFGSFLKFHDEIEAIAFEYTTGVANEECGQEFTAALCELAERLGRPMTLILRGGARWMATLLRCYANVIMVDATSCMRTINRRRAMLRDGHRLRWHKTPTAKGERLDELLAHNLQAVATSLNEERSAASPAVHPRPTMPNKSRSESDLHARDESLQGSLL